MLIPAAAVLLSWDGTAADEIWYLLFVIVVAIDARLRARRRRRQASD